jgi:protein JSN1
VFPQQLHKITIINRLQKKKKDYIGNTVVQKLFEYCNDQTKLIMIKKISPYLASIGIHKNGTWAAQKIIDTATTDEQVSFAFYTLNQI